MFTPANVTYVAGKALLDNCWLHFDSFKLSIEFIDWIYNNKIEFDIEFAGGVGIQFIDWWDDKVVETYKNFQIPIYSSLEDMIDYSIPEIVFSLLKNRASEYIYKVEKLIIKKA